MPISPFDGKEYLTFLFHQDGEEHLVPKSLFSKSRTIQHLVNHENQVPIQNIASSTFFHLTSFLAGNHQELTKEKISAMIEAAKLLGLLDTVKELTAFFIREE